MSSIIEVVSKLSVKPRSVDQNTRYLEYNLVAFKSKQKVYAEQGQRRRQDFCSGGGHFRGSVSYGVRGAEPPGCQKILKISK